MTRPLRIQYPGALYHITSRGNERQAIFINDNDRRNFLFILSDAIENHNLVCYAYCLMDNHYHLLLETPEANLSRGLQEINSRYSQVFNQSHQRVGHLFQGRFKSFVIEKEVYLMKVARYIVLNPVRAGLVEHPNQWPWSSYCSTAYAGKSKSWLNTGWLLKFFSDFQNDSRQQYRKFIEAGIDTESPFVEMVEGTLLGNQQFIDSIWQGVEVANSDTEIPRPDRNIGRPTLEELFVQVKDKEERDQLIISARKHCGYLIIEIARFLKLDASTVGKIVRGKYNSKYTKHKT